MKVLVIAGSISRKGGGVAEAARLLALALAEDPAIHVEVVTLKDEFTDTDLAGWGGLTVRSHSFVGPSNYGLSFGLLADVVKSRADIVHVHGIWMFYCFAVLLRFLCVRTPYVLTPHGMMERWIRGRSTAVKSAVSTLYQNAFLKRVAAFHVLTTKEIQDVEDMVPGRPTRVIPNYVAIPSPIDGSPGWWKPEWSGRDVYMFFGRLHAKKGCAELCAAWDELSADPVFRDRSLLVFCGWLDDMPDFIALVDEMAGRFGNVVYAGPQFGDDKPRSFQVATYFVLPSKSEGLPMSVLESWAAGVPVLMSRECNLPDGFETGAGLETGTTVPTIRDALRRASALTQGERQAMAAAGRGLIARQYTAAAVRTDMVALYQAVLGGTVQP